MDAPRPQFISAANALPSQGEDAGSGDADLSWLDRIISLTIDPVGNRPPAGAPGESPSAGTGSTTILPLHRLHPPARPARGCADPAATARLAASLAEHGILQPLLVRPRGIDFEIVAGLRRYEAAKSIGLDAAPVIMLALTDREALMVSLVENLQRDDLPALDEAQCYLRMLDEFGWTQDELARHLGRSRSHIANTLRLLHLPERVQALLDEGTLSAGHARALLTATDPCALAATIVEEKLSVRDTEARVQRDRPPAASARLENDLAQYERALAAGLGLKIRLHPLQRGGGKLVIYYDSTDALETALRGYCDRQIGD